MATVTITGNVKDVTGLPDNDTPWTFASVIRVTEAGEIITDRPQTVHAVNGSFDAAPAQGVIAP